MLEKDILLGWNNSEIVVSIICNTYNHELYVRDAIEGFLNQKTTFPFEVLIHDDASTDSTALIIKDYQTRYPSIIKPILQSVNQQSQGKSVTNSFGYPRVKGEFVAFCEGDDYWIDPYKLERQVEELNKYKDVNICFHPAITLNQKNERDVNCNYSDKIKVYKFTTVLKGGGGFMPTASVVFRYSVISQILSFYQQYPQKGVVGDIVFQFLGSLPGGVLYIPIKASIYRVFALHSWSSRITSDSRYYFSVALDTIAKYQDLNRFTNHAYEKKFQSVLMKRVLTYMNYKEFNNEQKQYFYNNYKEYLPNIFFIKVRNLYKEMKPHIKSLLKIKSNPFSRNK